MRDLVTFQASPVAYVTIAVLTGAPYLFGGFMREQICTYMCPWPRIQGAMLDEDSLVVTYHSFRGEPRGRHIKSQSAEKLGDCIDCNACVVVCPMGIDIRDGQQLVCITCALCIDACNQVMAATAAPKPPLPADTTRAWPALCLPDWQKPTPQMIHAGQAARWLKKRNSPLLKDPVLKSFLEQSEHIQESLPALCRKLMNTSENVQVVAPRLEITSFGGIVVRHNQRVVELSDWQTREARDLFLFLLQSPALTKEQIALVFWPDISPARLKVRFKINIYRIRQAIGQDAIVFEDDRYRFNRTINYTWDREEFDKLFEKLRQTTAAPRRARGLGQSPRVLAAIGVVWDYDVLAAAERAADLGEGGSGLGAR